MAQSLPARVREPDAVSAALLGEFPTTDVAQIAYNGNMVVLGLLGLWKIHYVRKHPELESHPMEPGTYHATLLRIGGLVCAGLAAIALALTLGTSFATLTYLSMIPIGRYGRLLERRARAASGPAVPHDSTSHDHP
ncbi:MAG: hypothetical protein ABI277_17250 [Burkholderiaceae bacterium]